MEFLNLWDSSVIKKNIIILSRKIFGMVNLVTVILKEIRKK